MYMIFGCTISMKVFPITRDGSASFNIALPSWTCELNALLGSLAMLFPPNFFKTVGISSVTLLTETFIVRQSMITSLTSSTFLPFSNVVMVSSSSKQGSCSNSLFFSLRSPALNSSFQIMAALCSFNKSSSLACMFLCL